MVGPRRGARLLLLLALLASISCRRQDTRPNLILILVDTLRSDHLHAYGYPRETSPHLDALARRGAAASCSSRRSAPLPGPFPRPCLCSPGGCPPVTGWRTTG